MAVFTSLWDLASYTGLVKTAKTTAAPYSKKIGRKEKVRTIVQHILVAHAELIKLENLNPGEIINRVLSNLVSVCDQVHETQVVEEVLANQQVCNIVPALRRICCDAEACLESYWNKHIIAGGNVNEVVRRLESFPYYQNYEDIARMELSALFASNFGKVPKRFAFVGSGPLPLTSLCILQALNNGMLSSPSTSDASELGAGTGKATEGSVEILNVDCNKEALEMSVKLGEKLGARAHGMKYACSQAGAPDLDLRGFDVVYLAALVGHSQTEKESILLGVVSQMRPGALLVVRTSWGLRTCLYPEVDLTTETLLERLQVCMVVHPYESVVNSVAIARVI